MSTIPIQVCQTIGCFYLGFGQHLSFFRILNWGFQNLTLKAFNSLLLKELEKYHRLAYMKTGNIHGKSMESNMLGFLNDY